MFVVDRSFSSYAVAIDNNEIIPCWSLSALMAQMPGVELVSSNDGHYRAMWKNKISEWYDNAVDACMELIEREEEEK